MRDARTLGIGREALLSLISKLVMAAVGFGGTVVFARVLGPSDLGVYRTALAAAFVMTQVSGGIGDAVKKRVSEIDVSPGVFLGGGIIVHFLATGVVFLGMLVLIGPASDYFGSVTISLGVVAVVATLGLFNVVNRFYAGIGYPARSSWMDTVRSVVTLILQLLLLFLGFEVIGLIGGLAIGTALTAIAAGRAAGIKPKLPDRESLDRLVSFAQWSIPNNLLTNLYSSADVMIITALVGTTAAGLYAVASQLVMPAAFIAGSIRSALYVKGSGRHSAGESVISDLNNSVAYTGLFAIPLLFGALAMPRAIPRTIFGPPFAAAGPALIGMALFQIGNAFASPFESIFQSVDRPDLVFRVNAVVTAIHLPLAVVGGIFAGLIGVVYATVVAETIRNLIYQYISYKTFDRIAIPRPIFEQVLSGAGMYLCLGAVLSVIGIKSWVVLSMVISIGALVYFGILVVVSSHFRLTIRYSVPIEHWPLKTPEEPPD